MKDYTKLFDELYVIDMTGFPFNGEDVLQARKRNLHRHYANGNNIFVLIGTKGGIEAFLVDYRYNHPRKRKTISDPVPLLSLRRK